MFRKVRLKMTTTTLLWDFSVRTTREIEARRPGFMIINKKNKRSQIIEVAIPENGGVRKKEDGVEKYKDLAREVGKMWGVRTKVALLILGAIPLRLNNNLRSIEMGILLN